jgi:thiamine pyrophosphokinase
MKKAIIFMNGDAADCSAIRKHIDKETLLIGCDGGARHILALGLTPHVVVGDFDSISPKILKTLERKGVELIRHPEDKSHTDSELCILLAKERGIRTIILTGVRGTHTDHMVGNLFLIAQKEFASLPMKIVEGKEEIFVVRKHVRIEGKKGDLVSLLPMGHDARDVTTKGLLYSLLGETLFSGSTRSLRNRMTGKRAEINVRSGAVLIVHRLA